MVFSYTENRVRASRKPKGRGLSLHFKKDVILALLQIVCTASRWALVKQGQYRSLYGCKD